MNYFDGNLKIVGTRPVRFEDGVLQTIPGEGLAADAVLSLPKLEGRRL